MRMKTMVFVVLATTLVATMAFSAGQQEAAEDESIEVSVLARYLTDAPPTEDHEIYDMMREETGATFDIDWVPGGGFNDMFRTRLATNDLPMITNIYTNGVVLSPDVRRAVQQGAFWYIGEYVQEHPNDFPNLALQDSGIREAGRIAGRDVFLLTEQDVGRPVWIYRADVAAELGFDSPPETSEEVYELISALGEEFDIGMALWKFEAPTHQWAWTNMFATWFGAPNNFGLDEDGNMTYAPLTDAWMEMLNFTKRLYDEGLVNSDFPAIGDQPTREMFSSGQAGMVRRAAGNIKSEFDRYEAEDLEFDDFDMFGTINGRGPSIGPGFSHATAIPRNEVETEEEMRQILSILDTVNDPSFGSLRVGYSEDELEWMDEEKTRARVPGQPDEIRNWRQAFWLSLKAHEPTTENPQTWKPDNELAMLRSGRENGVRDITVGLTSETYNEVGPQLEAIVVDAGTRYILGEIDEDEYWDEMDRWLEEGGEEVLEEYQQAHEERSGS